MNKSSASTASHTAELAQDGVTILPQVFAAPQIAAMGADLDAALASASPDSTSAGPLRAEKIVYAARNVLDWFPPARELWQTPPLTDLLGEVLGPDYGLTRALFFDKPPNRSWSLPWHKDLTIAVQDNRRPSSHFSHATTKAGVAHVEAPQWLLERMLTLRIHLDEVTDENGPLKVIAGSHRSGKAAAESPNAPQAIYARAGDVLAMRPLVSHSSGQSAPDTTRHRRILHLEFAGARELPDGYSWQTFIEPTIGK